MKELAFESPEIQAVLEDKTLDTQERYEAIEQLKFQYSEKQRRDADDGIITPQQQVFIECVASGANQSLAYEFAFPDSSPAAACSSASRLMRRPSIEKAVAEAREEARIAKEKHYNATLFYKLAAIKDKRATLQDIISGNRTAKTTIVNQDTGATIVKFREDPMLIIQAIKLDIKLTEMQEALEATIPADYTYEELDPNYRTDEEIAARTAQGISSYADEEESEVEPMYYTDDEEKDDDEEDRSIYEALRPKPASTTPPPPKPKAPAKSKTNTSPPKIKKPQKP